MKSFDIFIETTLLNKRTTGLNGHLSIRNSTHTTPLRPRGHEVCKFGKPFFGHYNYISSLYDLC